MKETQVRYSFNSYEPGRGDASFEKGLIELEGVFPIIADVLTRAREIQKVITFHETERLVAEHLDQSMLVRVISGGVQALQYALALAIVACASGSRATIHHCGEIEYVIHDVYDRTPDVVFSWGVYAHQYWWHFDVTAPGSFFIPFEPRLTERGWERTDLTRE